MSNGTPRHGSKRTPAPKVEESSATSEEASSPGTNPVDFKATVMLSGDALEALLAEVRSYPAPQESSEEPAPAPARAELRKPSHAAAPPPSLTRDRFAK